MRMALVGLMGAGLLPLLVALRANRATSLAHALVWTLVAWLSWAAVFLLSDLSSELNPWRFCALALTGAAGVAVLGARRPYVLAWNFVVLGLLAVILLPLVESLVIGIDPIDTLRIFFLTATIGVGICNYLPTRLGPAALVLAAACAGQIVVLFAPSWLNGMEQAALFDGTLASVPWIAWLGFWRRRPALSEFDRLWLSFRDRWGLLWSQRVREQFNQAAQNAGWPVLLYWQGLVMNKTTLTPVDENKLVETLRAVLQRFIEADQG